MCTGSVCAFLSRLHSFHSVSKIAVTFGLLNRAPSEDACDCNLVVFLYIFLFCSPFITTSASALSLACSVYTLPPPSFCSPHLFLLLLPFSSLNIFLGIKEHNFLLYAYDRMFKMMTQRSVLEDLKAFFHEVTVTGFVYKPIIFLSLDVLSCHSTWGWSSWKTVQKLGIACCGINALMHTLMHLSLGFLWQTGVLQYADMVTNTDKLFLDRGLKIQVNTEKPRLLWHHVCRAVEIILLKESLPLWPAV